MASQTTVNETQLIIKKGGMYKMRITPEQADEIRTRTAAGETVQTIALAMQIPASTAWSVQKRLGIESPGVRRKDRQTIATRRGRMRELATDGYSSRQIAAKVGMTEDSVRLTLRKMAVKVPGDQVTNRTRRHDSNRVLDNITNAVENLAADLQLVDLDELDRARFNNWAYSLKTSIRTLARFTGELARKGNTDEAA